MTKSGAKHGQQGAQANASNANNVGHCDGAGTHSRSYEVQD